MEANYPPSPAPATRSIWNHLSSFLLKLEEHRQTLKSLEDLCMPENVLPQTAEDKVDVQWEGNSTSPQEHENKMPRNTFRNLEKSSDVTRFRGCNATVFDLATKAIQTNGITGSGLRNATKQKGRAKVKIKTSFSLLLVALAMLTLLPGREGSTDQYMNRRVNQSVNLSAGAKEGDSIKWFRSPKSNPEAYFKIYPPEEVREEDNCGGYHFEKDHSIFIAKLKPCHAGTYTWENTLAGESGTIILNVNDTAEVTVSEETTDVSGTEFGLSSTPAPNKDSNRVTTIALAVTSSLAIGLLAVVSTILWLKGYCKRPWNKTNAAGNNNNAIYTPANTNEDVEKTPDGRLTFDLHSLRIATNTC